MLGKLLKYEMKASARTLVPLYIGTLVVAAICSIQVALTFGQPNNADVWMSVGTFRTSSNVAGFLFLLFFGLCVAITVLTIMTVIQRFNTSLIGNEGYLMFTLPVTHAQLLSSKLIGAMLWSVIGTCVMFLAQIYQQDRGRQAAETIYRRREHHRYHIVQDIIQLIPQLVPADGIPARQHTGEGDNHQCQEHHAGADDRP